MLTYIRTHWRRISTGMLAFAFLGAAVPRIYQSLRGDCCQPGSPCCHPGSPCCPHAHAGNTEK
jgi:hypothetical protein